MSITKHHPDPVSICDTPEDGERAFRVNPVHTLIRRMIGPLIWLTFWLPTTPGWAYTEHSVTHGGHISGVVTLQGTAPAPKAFNLIAYPEPVFCGRISTGNAWRLLDQIRVAPDGGLQHAVVMVEGVQRGKPFPTAPPTIEARDCHLTPPVLAVRNPQTIHIVNMDPIIHDIQVYEVAPFGSEVLWHRPLRMNPHHPNAGAGTHDHLPGAPLIDTIAFTKNRRVFYLECGFHEFMQTWGVAVTNPYYAVTDAKGHFTISDIPEGVYTLLVWHPGMGGFLDMQAVVIADDTLHVQLAFEKAVDRRMAHTTMVENPHYGIGTLDTFGERIHIQPTHQIQTP